MDWQNMVALMVDKILIANDYQMRIKTGHIKSHKYALPQTRHISSFVGKYDRGPKLTSFNFYQKKCLERKLCTVSCK